MINHGIWFTLLALLFAGCSSIGPTSVHHDRFDYNKALSDSWKEQTLLNIVRLRYAHMPIFLEVASIVSGYTLEGSVKLTGNVSSDNTVQGDFLTRSMLQMMIALSTFVDVPEGHLEEKMTYPIKYQPREGEAELGPLMMIHGGAERPENTFVSVKHLNHWFWIDESDFASKRTFTFLMLLFSMMESEDSEGLPLVTIPAG